MDPRAEVQPICNTTYWALSVGGSDRDKDGERTVKNIKNKK